jgi:hypothetical protein
VLELTNGARRNVPDDTPVDFLSKTIQKAVR